MAIKGRELSAACYITGNKYNKCDMIKLVVNPNDNLCFDLKQNLLGESFFITNSELILIEFLKIMKDNNKHVFFGNLKDSIIKTYIQQMLSIISLAKKSGSLILGKEKINDYLQKSNIIKLFQDRVKLGSNFTVEDNKQITYIKRFIQEEQETCKSLNEENFNKKDNKLKDIGGSKSPNSSFKNKEYEYIIIQAKEVNAREEFSINSDSDICEIFNSTQLSTACGKKNIKNLLITNQIAKLFKKFYNKYNCYVKV